MKSIKEQKELLDEILANHAFFSTSAAYHLAATIEMTKQLLEWAELARGLLGDMAMLLCSLQLSEGAKESDWYKLVDKLLEELPE